MKARSVQQVDLAAALGVKPQYISRMKSGDASGVTYWAKIAEILDVPVQWLTTGSGPAPAWAPPPKPAPPLLARVSGERLAIAGSVSAGDGWTKDQAGGTFKMGAGWCAVHVEGWSAYPVVYPEQWVIVDTDRTRTLETWDDSERTDLDDNLVLIHTTDGRGLLKRFCKADGAPGGFVLASVNSGLETPWVPPEQVVSITPVVGVLYENPEKPRVKKYRMRKEPAMQVITTKE